MLRSLLYVRYTLSFANDLDTWTRYAPINFFMLKSMTTEDIFRALTTILENIHGKGTRVQIVSFSDPSWTNAITYYNYFEI